MLRLLIPLLAMLHGVIHLLGTAKAFQWDDIQSLTRPVTRVAGIGWAIACILFIVSGILQWNENRLSWIPLFPAVLLSQWLIIIQWTDAKSGTLPNIILLVAAISMFAHWRYYQSYSRDVHIVQQQSPVYVSGKLVDQDIAHLPIPVQRYIRYAGCIGQPRVSSFRVNFKGRIRSKGGSWMSFTSEQQNFLYPPTRLFWMEAMMKGLPVDGYHRYRSGMASMDIRLLSLFKVQYAAGDEMNIAETITFFNDLCIMAPAALTDSRIRWESVNGDTVQAAFTNGKITVKATLLFAADGRLLNFISDERFNTQEGKRMRWATPLKTYAGMNGYRLGVEADLVYTYPETDFVYGEFRMTDLVYNP